MSKFTTEEREQIHSVMDSILDIIGPDQPSDEIMSCLILSKDSPDGEGFKLIVSGKPRNILNTITDVLVDLSISAHIDPEELMEGVTSNVRSIYVKKSLREFMRTQQGDEA